MKTAMWRIGGEAKGRDLPRAALYRKDVKWRAHAALMLGEVGAAAKDMVPTLRLLLRDADATVRVSAARSLWRLAAEESALPVMIELLSAKQDDERRDAATGLGEIGPAAKKAVPALKRAVHADDDRFVQRLAAKALEKISPDKPKAR